VQAGLVTLPATLSLPKGEGSFPGVILVHGSGPHDRDETVGGTRVFQDLAQGLASRGIAVLRYDKRTKTYQKELAGTRDMTLKDEVLDDAVAALAVLRRTAGVDQAKLFVLGHSLGAVLAPRIALLDEKTAGIILLAAPSRPMSEVVHDQVEALAGPRASEAQKATAPALRREADALADLYAGRSPASAAATIFGASPAYWLELKSQTPAVALSRLGLPVLVLQGGRDYQVSMKDFAGWERALKGVPRATLKAYPKLNHLFVAGEGPSAPAEYEKPGHVDREVVEDIAAFVMRGSLHPPDRQKKK
jgi:dienelactone hydrolase